MGEVEVVVQPPQEEEMMLDTQEVVITTAGGEAEKPGTESTSVGELLDDMITEVSTTDGVSSISPKKRLKSEEVAVKEGRLTEENKENLVRELKQLSRKELEDTVLLKVVEGLMKHSEAGKFRMKVAELSANKEKLQQRVSHLQKQVVEMGKAVKLLLDNHNRDPNNLNPNKKRPPPIRFYRSVGLQVSIEPSVKTTSPKVIHVNNVNAVPLNSGKPLGNLNNLPATPASIPPKRPGPKSLTDPKAISKPHIVSPNPAPLMPKTLTQVNGHVTVSNNVKPSILSSAKPVSAPTVVDLTDDSGPVDGSASVVPTPVRVVHNVTQGVPQVQLLQTAVGAMGYQIVPPPDGQNRPYMLAQQQVAGVQRPQAVVIRNVTPKPNVMTTQVRPNNRPVPTSPIPTRMQPAAVIKAPQQQQLLKKNIQLPPTPNSTNVALPRGKELKEIPPRPILTLNEQSEGIVLSWTMKIAPQYEDVASYQIYACQESIATSPGKTSSWKKVGDVKALPLPMACTLSQFTQGNRYFFIVRAVDAHGRSGAFCDAGQIVLERKS